MNNIEKPKAVNVAAQNGGKKEKKNRSRLIPLIFSLLLAFALWFYVVSVESPVYEKTFSLVPVTVVQSQEEGALSVYSGGTAAVELTVSGRRSVLNQLTVEDFDLRADVSGYTTAGKYDVPLTFGMPEGTTKVSSNIDYISVYLDNRISVNLPVTVKFTEYSLDEGYEIAESALEKSAETVVVTGPKSVLDTIVSAQMTAELGHVTSSKKLSGRLELVDAAGAVIDNPYVTSDITDVTVRVPIYLTRELPLKAEFKHGLFNSDNARVVFSPSTVTVKGEVDYVSDLDGIVVTTIDEKLAQEGKTTLSFTPAEGLTAIDGTESVEMNLSLSGLVTKTVAVTNIKVKNPSGYSYTPASESCNITLRGTRAAIAEISEEDISITVDISGITLASSTVSAAAEIVIDDEYDGEVLEVGEYTIQLER